MSTTKYTPRLADKYKKEVVPALMKKFAYKTVMQAPKLQKLKTLVERFFATLAN